MTIRLDLQGIRGLAIVVVIGFHYYPTIIPNGYLGVDQFFVLSGYLMCMLLKRSVSSQLETCSLITTFYIRRFKRIIPLYYLIILLSIISLYTIFPKTAIRTNQESAIRALVFVSNRQQTQQEDYFKMLSLAIDIFTHTWSLSVEVQFYLIIPIIYIILRWINIKYEIISYLLIASLSLIYHLILPPFIAFNNMFARMWQFFIGMIVYQICEKYDPRGTDDNKNGDYIRICDNDKCEENIEEMNLITEEITDNNKHETSSYIISTLAYIILIIIITILMFPIELSSIVARPLITCLTGILILISVHNQLLSNPVITYLGNISYVLYLVHWPIYAYCKLMGLTNYLMVFLGFSVIISILIHHLYEKWYLSLISTNIAILVIVLLISSCVMLTYHNIFVQYKRNLYDNRDYINYSNDTMVSKDDPILDKAAELNKLWVVEDFNHLFTNHCVYDTPKSFSNCHMKDLNPKNPLKLAMIGNSWAANTAQIFWEECKGKAREILNDAEAACEPLYPSEACISRLDVFYQRVKKFEPDYLFIVTRFITIGTDIRNGSIELDPTYLTMKKWLLKYLNIVKKDIYILGAMPKIRYHSAVEVAYNLKAGFTLNMIDKDQVVMDGYDNAQKRYHQLISDCGDRCHLIDYKPDFYDAKLKRWRFFDKSNGFSYMTDGLHLTPHGLEKIRYHYTDICRKLE